MPDPPSRFADIVGTERITAEPVSRSAHRDSFGMFAAGAPAGGVTLRATQVRDSGLPDAVVDRAAIADRSTA
jgi:hypothetical protein